MAYVVGFFVDDIEGWKTQKEVVTREATVIPERSSCSHVNLENCRSNNPKFCSECGIKTRVIPEEKISEVKKTVFTGYKNDIFPYKQCGCFDCYECFDHNCQNCVTCPCQKCKIHSVCKKNLLECDCIKCNDRCKRGECHGNKYKTVDSYNCKVDCQFSSGTIDIWEYPELWKMESYFDEEQEAYICGHYGKDCSDCKQKYYENLKVYYLKEGYRLAYVDSSFCILYEVSTYSIDVDDELITFRQNLLKYCERNEIKGNFEVRYIPF